MGCGSSKSTKIVTGAPPPSAKSRRSKKSRSSVGFSVDAAASATKRMDSVEEEEPESEDSERLYSEDEEEDGLRRHQNLAVLQVSPRLISLRTAPQFVVWLSTDKHMYGVGETAFISVVALDYFTHTFPWRFADLFNKAKPCLVVKRSEDQLCVFRQLISFERVQCRRGFEVRIPCAATCGEYGASLELECSSADVGWNSNGCRFYVKEFHVKNFDIDVTFMAKAYKAGEIVQAFIRVLLPSGQPVSSCSSLTAVAQFKDKTIHEKRYDLKEDGLCFVSFDLPQDSGGGDSGVLDDAFLNCQTSNGGLTGFVKTSIPLEEVIKLSTYPEGGSLVMGLRCGLYFSAKRKKSGERIDVTVLLEERNADGSKVKIICNAATAYKGRGRLEFKVRRGKKYCLSVVQPYGMTGQCDLPPARQGGVCMQVLKCDDTPGLTLIRIGSTLKSQYVIRAFSLGKELSSVNVSFPFRPVAANRSQAVWNEDRYQDVCLTIPSSAAGIIRILASSPQGLHCCQKLIYRRPQRRLDVSVQLVRPKTLVTGCDVGEACLEIETKDSLTGLTAPASVVVSVVDDSVWSLSQMSERQNCLPAVNWLNPAGAELDDPDLLISDNSEASLAIDLILSTNELASDNPSFQSEILLMQSQVLKKENVWAKRCAHWIAAFKRSTMEKTGRDDTSSPRDCENAHLKILQAVCSADFRVVENLCNEMDLKDVEWNGESLLHCVIRFHSKKRPKTCQKMLEMLTIDAGLDPNRQRREAWSDGNAAIHLACQMKAHESVIKKLLKLGASASQRNGLGQTPLTIAASFGHLKGVQTLLSHAFESARGNHERRPSLQMVGALDGTGWNAFHYAAAGGHCPILESLKSFAKLTRDSVDWNMKTEDSQKMNLLHIAARYIGAFSDLPSGEAENVVDATVQYLRQQGVKSVPDARGYSYSDLKYLRTSVEFGVLSRYGKRKERRRQKEPRVSPEEVVLTVKYRSGSKVLPALSVSTEICTVIEMAAKGHDLVLPLRGPAYFLVMSDYSCLLDELLPCSVPVRVVSRGQLCQYRLNAHLEVREDMVLGKYVEEVIRANNVDAVTLASGNLSATTVIRRSNFLLRSSSLGDRSDCDFEHTPMEYGLQPRTLLYVSNIFLPADALPSRRTILSDYGIRGGGGGGEARPLEISLYSMEVNINWIVQVTTEMPRMGVEMKEGEAEEPAAPARPPTKKGPKGKGAPPKAGGKKKGDGKQPAPAGKLVKLSLSAFEPLMNAKERLANELKEFMLKEAKIQLDDDPPKKSLDFRFYIDKRLVPEHIPIYATSLMEMPMSSSSPVAVTVHPRSVPHFVDLTRLYDFWTTTAWFEIFPNGIDDESDVESESMGKASDSEDGYRGDSGDSDGERMTTGRKRMTKKSARRQEPVRGDSEETETTTHDSRPSSAVNVNVKRDDDDCGEIDGKTKEKDSGEDLIEQKRRKAERKRRIGFFAWHSKWYKVMLRWGNDTLRGHTSALRWIVPGSHDGDDDGGGGGDGVAVSSDKLGDAGMTLAKMSQFYGVGTGEFTSVHRNVASRCYSDDTFEDYESEVGGKANEECREKEKIETPKRKATEQDIVYVHEERTFYEKGVSLTWEDGDGAAPACNVQVDSVFKGKPCKFYLHKKKWLPGVDLAPKSVDTLLWSSGVDVDPSKGCCSLQLPLRKNTTNYRILVNAFSSSLGLLGHTNHLIEIQKHFSVNFQLPVQLSFGDKIATPVVIMNNSESKLDVELASTVTGGGNDVTGLLRGESAEDDVGESAVTCQVNFEGSGAQSKILQIDTQQDRKMNEIKSITWEIHGKVFLIFMSGEHKDRKEAALAVSPCGYLSEQSCIGMLEGEEQRELTVGRTTSSKTKVCVEFYPSPISILHAAVSSLKNCTRLSLDQQATLVSLTSMLFQQTQNSDVSAVFVRDLFCDLQQSLRQLLKFRRECGGFSFFHNSCADPLATAVAIQTLKTAQMAISVEAYLLNSAKEWLLRERHVRGKGYDVRMDEDLFHPSCDLITAYISWSLTEAGFNDKIVGSDVAMVEDRFLESDEDPYALALICLSLYNAGDSEAGQQIADKLVNWQQEDGRVCGTQDTVTQSSGLEKDVETTCLAILCWLKGEEGNEERPLALKAVKWLLSHYHPLFSGTSSYMTVLALKVLFLYFEVCQFKVDLSEKSAESLPEWDVDVAIGDGLTRTVNVGNGMDKAIVELMEPSERGVRVQLSIKKDAGNQFLPYCVKSVAYEEREDETFSQRTSLILGVRLGAPQLEVGNKAVIEVSLKNEEEVRKPAVSCELGIPAGLQVDEEDFRTQCQSNESLKAFKLDSSTLLLFLTLDKAQEISFSVPVTAAYAGRFTGQPSFAVQLSNPSSGKVWAQCLAVEIGASYLPIPPPPPSPPPTQQEEEEKDDAKEDSPEEDASAKKPLE
eukprot:m.36548 g.36548  ORF g.36548 m.36548 type:complete len:2409 (+) comp32262_c0_seq5:144-7370(+)